MGSDRREPHKGGARLQKSTSGGHKPGRKWAEMTPREKTLRVLVIIAVTLAAILLLLLAAWRIFVQKPTIPGEPQVPDLPQVSGMDIDLERPNRTNADRKKDFFTFLVIGRDTGGGGNTDTILLAAYDVPNQELNVMSIPRDTMVNVPWDIKRINSVYNFYGGGDDGIKALYKEISQLVGFVPEFQVVVEWDAVGELVEAIGGVYFDVPRNMNYDDPTQDLHIHISKGYQKLNGEQAMGVVRYRHDNDMRYGYPDGDLGRIKTQQALLKAVVAQCLKIENIARINQLAKVFTDNVTTDLSINNLAWFADKAIFGGLSMDNVNFFTMPNEGHMVWSRSYNSYQSYVTPVEDELVELVNRHFNPYVDDLETSELDIMSVGEDGRLYSTTGHVEDTKANSAAPSGSGSTSRPSSEPEPSREPELPVSSEEPTLPPETEEPTVPATPEPSAEPAPEPVPEPSAEPAPEPVPEPTAAPDPEPVSGGGEGEAAPPPESME